MRRRIREFLKNIDLIDFISKKRVSIAEMSRLLKIPYSTLYVRLHKLEKFGLIEFDYVYGKKTPKLTKLAEEMLNALEEVKEKEKLKLR